MAVVCSQKNYLNGEEKVENHAPSYCWSRYRLQPIVIIFSLRGEQVMSPEVFSESSRRALYNPDFYNKSNPKKNTHKSNKME